jgi:hypothetical protein
MVRPEGFEPPTHRSVVYCSNPLSYGRIRAYEIFISRARGQDALDWMMKKRRHTKSR